MREVTPEALRAALAAVGVQAGNRLLIHAAIQFLGRAGGGVGMYLDLLLEALQPAGTLVVPAFNFDFAKGQPYDPHSTPSRGMGVFAEQVRQQPEARRSLHPLQSVAALGSLAEAITRRDTPGAFDPSSAFEALLDLDFDLLLLGADIQAASMVHYSEQRASVPYRYWKEFRGQVCTPTGWELRTYRMFVRDLTLNPILDLHPIQARLQERGLWRETTLNYGKIARCRLADFVAAADDLLANDPWSLVSNPQ